MRRFSSSLHVLIALLAVLICHVSPSRGQTCWVYTDTVQAPAPMKCVQKANLTQACSWPTDCTAIPGPAETIRKLHEDWHACFGAQGGPTPPPGRGNRWYAFHRQFEWDFDIWRKQNNYATIEGLQWCPGMNLYLGTAGALYNPPADVVAAHCNQIQIGPNNFLNLPARPPNKACPSCVAFAHCLFKSGGGPLNCPNAPSNLCRGATFPGTANFVSFPYTSLDEFKNIDEVTQILDWQFHGIMHVASGQADAPAANCDLFGTAGTGSVSGCYNLDTLFPNCAPRDPMFWRLHKSIDDVVRAWQDDRATDVVLVIDRSGSMSQPDVGSGTSKLTAALNAVEDFADMLDTNRTDGQKNRIGVVSYSDNASIDMQMTDADPNLLAVNGPLETAKNNIAAQGPAGCTGIGKAIQKAVDILCPPAPGNCSTFTPPQGTNTRKAILVMTDGIENVPPCLQPAGANGGTCGNQCFGASFDYNNLAFTQVVTVGFGSGADLNGPLLTQVAERQGGIYMQNPNANGFDLKNYFTKAFGELTSEFVLIDPKGTLPAAQPATEPFTYGGCTDSVLTFSSGWNQSVTPGDLTLVVETPNGDLVSTSDPAVQNSRRALWHFSRVRLPYHGANSGTWRGQIIRPHHQYVNGFVTDAFADPKEGTALIRREIHRLCPQGCKKILYYEFGRKTPQSVYRDALQAEKQAGLLGTITTANTDAQFTRALGPNRWDLIVYAQMGKDVHRPYDALLRRVICANQRAIITDTRRENRVPLFSCLGVQATEPVNWMSISANDSLVDHPLKLVNTGYPVFTYGLTGTTVQATSPAAAPIGAIVGRIDAGKDEAWFADILGTSLGKLSPHYTPSKWKTGEEPIAEVRMLPSDIRAGGWDNVNARVEVTYPTVGVGTLLAQRGLGDSRTINKEPLDARTLALSGINVPTATQTFRLYDDGTHGDLIPQNAYWTAELTGLGKTDGQYNLRYIFDLTANGCTTHRELAQSFYMDVGIDPKASKVNPGVATQLPNGWRRFNVTLSPADVTGNLIGPGRTATAMCAPKGSCRVDPAVVDIGRGIYKVAIDAAPNAATVQMQAFDTPFDVPLDCANCPRLAGMTAEPDAVVDYQPSRGTITLSGPAPDTAEGGAVVFLSSDVRNAASVPNNVVVPAGKTTVTFPITVYHVHDQPERVTIAAAYGDQRLMKTVTVTPENYKPTNPQAAGLHHRHDD
jgi:hypothetical protein